MDKARADEFEHKSLDLAQKVIHSRLFSFYLLTQPLVFSFSHILRSVVDF